MAEGRGSHPGGILSLVDRLEDSEKRRALEADLINAGMRLRWFPAPDYTWGDLVAFVSGLDHSSVSVRAELGEDAMWGLQEQLLALNADYLRILIWQRTPDGQKGRKFPKPIKRPGVDDGVDRKKIGGTTKVPAEELAKLLGV